MKYLSPPRIVYIAFILIIFAGATLLHMPLSWAEGRSLSWMDALFTSTSAICVTGLSVIDPGIDLSFIGQIVLVILIQIGGMGIMTISGFLFVLIGRNIGMRGRMILIREREEEKDVGGIHALLMKIVFITLLIEAIGVGLMFWRLGGAHAEDPLLVLFHSIFFTISGFCNAGFSLFSDSLMPFQARWDINVIMMSLIILGGLGYPVLWNLLRSLWSRFPFRRCEKKQIGLHSKIVLMTTYWIILIGVVGIFFIEFAFSKNVHSNSLLLSIFQTISARSAGFSTLNTGSMNMATLFFICALMFIGGSPASTGGGIKTTSFAIIISSIRSSFLGRKDVSLFNRNISNATVQQAFVVLTFSFVWIAALSLILCMTEPNHRFIELLFEATSAYATVGLSTGITLDLSVAGQIMIMSTMLVGRLSAITLLMSMIIRQDVPSYRYPDEKVLL